MDRAQQDHFCPTEGLSDTSISQGGVGLMYLGSEKGMVQNELCEQFFLGLQKGG